jgi:GR25 family glycosyltransferase involved in LPS biosynthesis
MLASRPGHCGPLAIVAILIFVGVVFVVAELVGYGPRIAKASTPGQSFWSQVDNEIATVYDEFEAQTVGEMTVSNQHVPHNESAHPRHIGTPFDGANMVGKAWYINLDSATTRRTNMEKQLRNSGLVYQRFSALTLANLSDVPKRWWVPGLSSSLTGRNSSLAVDIHVDGSVTIPLTRSEMKGMRVAHLLACYLSHRTLWERIASTADEKWHLVFEDDVVLPNGWSSRLQPVLQRSGIPDGWSAIRFNTWSFVNETDLVSGSCVFNDAGGCSLVNGSGPHTRRWTSDSACIYRSSGPYYNGACGYFYMGAHATLLTPASARRLLKYIERSPINTPDAMLVTAPNDFVVLDKGLPHLN